MAVQRIEGVREARFSWPEGTGVVEFDTTVTSLDVIVSELKESTGFDALPRQP